MSAEPKVRVLVGTRKGGFIFSSDRNRKAWSVSDMLFKGWNMMHMVMDPRDGRLHTAVNHFVFGATTHYSDDLGETWTQSPAPPRFSRPSASGRPGGTPEEAYSGRPIPKTPEQVLKVWNIEPGRADEPGVLYAGSQPAIPVQIDRPRRKLGAQREPLRSPASRQVESRRGRTVPAQHRP